VAFWLSLADRFFAGFDNFSTRFLLYESKKNIYNKIRNKIKPLTARMLFKNKKDENYEK